MQCVLRSYKSKPWAGSLLRRIDFVKRKATKAARKLPGNFTELKSDFHRRVTSIVEEHSIPAQLVINMDETGLPTVPVSQWTLEEAGSRQVPVFGLEDKRQITALLACSATGTLLPPHTDVSSNDEVITCGWEKAGLLDAINLTKSSNSASPSTDSPRCTEAADNLPIVLHTSVWQNGLVAEHYLPA